MDLKSIIDVGALKSNYKTLTKLTAADICVMVKADAYGHGLIETARALSDYGAKIKRPCIFGTATAEEALALRAGGINNGILIVGGLQSGYAAELVKAGVTSTVLSEGDVRLLDKAARSAGTAAQVHLKLDTGMHRLGLSKLSDVKKVFDALSECKNVVLGGIFTHYATADSNIAYLDYQYDVFSHMLSKIKEFIGAAEYERLKIHGANTGALLTDKKYHMDMARTGLLIYGYGRGADGRKIRLKPAMSVATRIVQLSAVAAGEFIGYGNNYRLERDSVLAVIRAGYGDGYKRGLSNKGMVSIGGRLCPVIGNVCMDLCVIDVTDARKIGYNDVVYLLNAQITAEDLAARCGTISYDILTSFSRRMNRIYV